ncbi:pantoate--beta-alanine ligase [Oecophyllibacter saccharovorans]|nr:pantoate--beta-alanine ligase [Oecophyllibacter saccharovorans]
MPEQLEIKMQICRSVEEVRRLRPAMKAMGFVPTMGFLHEGHLSLVRQAAAENDTVAVSIFVNPLQFDSAADLDHYPRAVERDLALLEKEGVDLVFLPTAELLYPPGFATRVEVGGVADRLEGPARPGHFSGVATVVAKLFNILQPQQAYFGRKDAQQCAVISRMVHDLNLPVEVVTAPTFRESDGLAASSRNARLTPAQRRQAPALYQALEAARQAFSEGERNRARLEALMTRTLAEQLGENAPDAEGRRAWETDYATIVDPDTFVPSETLGEEALALLAVRLGEVRLIDNMLLNSASISAGRDSSSPDY